MEVVVELQRGQRLIEESEGEMASLKTYLCMGRLGGNTDREKDRQTERKCVTLNSQKIHSRRQNWACRKMWIGDCYAVRKGTEKW